MLLDLRDLFIVPRFSHGRDLVLRNRLDRRRRFLQLFAVCVIFTFAFVGVAWWLGGSLVAAAHRRVGPPPTGLNVESVTIASKSNSALAAWYVPAADARATVILLHPIRGDRRVMLARAWLLHDRGYSTLLFDFQAHGESPGDHITVGYLERHDVLAAVEYVRGRHPDHRIGIIGCSLGGAAALLATPPEIDALILESVYPTISEAVHNRVSMRLGPLHHVMAPVLLAQLRPRLGISPSGLRPIECIGNFSCPVLIAVGELDQHTTVAETRRMYDAACEPKQLAIFPHAGHTDLLNHNPSLYEQKIVSFLNAHLRPQDTAED